MKAKALLVLASILAATFGASAARAADAPPPKISAERIRDATSQIDDERLKHPKVGEWITYNGSPNEQRYSPLDQINDKNVPELKLAWRFPTNSTRGLEATPRLTTSQQAFCPHSFGTLGSQLQICSPVRASMA